MMKYAEGHYFYYYYYSLYIYFFTLIILNSSTQVLLLLYKCPKAIIFIYYGGIDLRGGLSVENDKFS